MIFGKKIFLFFKNNFTRINHCKFIHHKNHLKSFLSYLPCIVHREYFSIIFKVKKCAIWIRQTKKFDQLSPYLFFNPANMFLLGWLQCRLHKKSKYRMEIGWVVSKKLYFLSNLWMARVFVTSRPFHPSPLFASKTSDLYYKTITIVIMTMVSDTTIWSVTYNRNWWH